VDWIGTYLLPVASVLTFAKTPPCSVEEKFTKAQKSASSQFTGLRTANTGNRKAGPLWGGGEIQRAPSLTIDQIVVPRRG
jgi:hypothetical protein